MKKTILVVAAVAGLSVLAVGQSDKKQADPKPADQVTAPREASSGMATGKKGNYDLKEGKGAVQEESQSTTAREASTGKATGKMQNVSADASTQTATQPAVQHEVKSPRDAASGLATGKRQHAPVTTTTTTDDTKNNAQPKK